METILKLVVAAALLFPAALEARSMYCTRHRASCQERRDREARAYDAYAAWYTSLSPKDRQLADMRDALYYQARNLHEMADNLRRQKRLCEQSSYWSYGQCK